MEKMIRFPLQSCPPCDVNTTQTYVFADLVMQEYMGRCWDSITLYSQARFNFYLLKRCSAKARSKNGKPSTAFRMVVHVSSIGDLGSDPSRSVASESPGVDRLFPQVFSN